MKIKNSLGKIEMNAPTFIIQLTCLILTKNIRQLIVN